VCTAHRSERRFVVKLVLTFCRNPDLEPEAFLAYWREKHVPLVKKVPGILRYTISPVLWSPDSEKPAFDGMAELIFESRESLEEALASPEAEATAHDGRVFIARGTIRRVVTEELQVIPPDPRGLE
jgi:uncharacterized protein (TIGR02118 family)